MTAISIAAPRLPITVALRPECASANPPLRPRAINRYRDKNLEIAGGISRFDLSVPASTPNTKNRIAGSSRFCIGVLLLAPMLWIQINLIKSIVRYLYIDEY